MVKQDGLSMPFPLRFLVLKRTPVAGGAKCCMPKKSLRACSAAATARWVPTQGAALGPGGRTRKMRPHIRGSRRAHGTCRGRSRLCFPGQRRAAGRGRLRPNRRGLGDSEACRPRFPPHNVSSGERQSLALAVRPELSRPTVQVSTVCH